MLHYLHILNVAATLLSSEGKAAESDVRADKPVVVGSFDHFKIISDRNIFNQNRSARSARREAEATRPPPVVHALSLVGTISYARGQFAFFEGTSPDFRKPVKTGDKIAGYEVREVSPSGVKIAKDTQELELKVGQQLRREGEGEWQVSTSPAPIAAPAVNSGEAGAQGATSSSANASEDEALKRLMEKRAKELNP